MRHVIPAVAAVIVLSAACAAQPSAAFRSFFVDETMRVDTYHTGNANEEIVTLDRVLIQGTWAGSLTRLIDPFDTGRYAVKVIDPASGRLIYSNGYDSYFSEYQTTEAAAKGVRRTCHESVLIPCPKKPVRFVLESRDRRNVLHPLFETVIDPAASTVLRKPLDTGVKVYELHKSGDAHRKMDLALIAEGYTAEDEAKLRADFDRFVRVFFAQEPFASLKDRFNITGVFKPSDEAGCDEPGYGIFKNTSVGASFDSLGSERYVLIEDNRTLRDIAAHTPYDTMAVMINHSRYGGGGIYNLYCTFTVDNPWHDYLFLHEFGHAFGGLADEYYTSAVAYNEFYPKGVEPREPNITALLDPANLKWRAFVTPGTAVPTPWEKSEFDAKDMAYQKVRQEINERIATLKRSGAPKADVAKLEEESERRSREQAQWVDRFLAASKFAGQIGAFEGAGYAARGLFRPAVDCIMFTKGAKPYCKICEAALRRRIDFTTD
jgi:hypothetical protein